MAASFGNEHVEEWARLNGCPQEAQEEEEAQEEGEEEEEGDG